MLCLNNLLHSGLKSHAELLFNKWRYLVLKCNKAAQSVILTFLTFVHASNFQFLKLLIVFTYPTAELISLGINLFLKHLNQIATTVFTQQVFIKHPVVVLARQKLFFNSTDLPFTNVGRVPDVFRDIRLKLSGLYIPHSLHIHALCYNPVTRFLSVSWRDLTTKTFLRYLCDRRQHI